LIWSAAFALMLGLRFELEYRDRLKKLPTLVDEHGVVDPMETEVERAMAGLDSYDRAKRIRKFGFASAGIGALLFVGALVTKHDA
jgi:hypothetical protein